jgi:hypothetical protein
MILLEMSSILKDYPQIMIEIQMIGNSKLQKILGTQNLSIENTINRFLIDN